MRDKDETAREMAPELTAAPIARGFETAEQADLRAAKERLGAWLTDKNFRSHCVYGGDGDFTATLVENAGYKNQEETLAGGTTKAAAILAALEKVGG